ncbi:metal ABC transporter substrate-binding protein [Jeongeupia chitinilytica]|uniref:Metal ABC transporter substrate-binding protein n=1 Tax=Jeongeupia chitinilytica TaxID=1041641 RepID=A0ABQ3GVG1_9NEIS|nr:metal ABC transporter substrate-binding protein [Jeongeupia chitinilytica]GHD57009.1 metal ABC transporter substrate-binding protein [Jeongeupia chitinilytica]
MIRRCILGVALAIGVSGMAQAAEPLPVVASFSILGDLVQNVGGDRIKVATLVGADGDAHVYQPTPADVGTLAKSRVFFVNGLGFEGWMKRLTASSKYKGTVVTVSDGIKPRAMAGDDHDDHGHDHGTDPHAWQDIGNARLMVKNIAGALTKIDPAGASLYQANAKKYDDQLVELSKWADAQVATIPEARRKVITSHDAFGYLGARYRITLLSPQGLSTEAEASAKDVGRLIRQIKQSGIKAVFVENISNRKLIDQISRETGASLEGELYSDALSSKPEASSYLNMYRHNITTLVAGMKANR